MESTDVNQPALTETGSHEAGPMISDTNILKEPCPVGEFNDGTTYIKEVQGKPIHDEMNLGQIAKEYSSAFGGAIPQERIHIWLSTFPERFIDLGVEILENFRFIGLSQLQQRMLMKMDRAMNKYDGNILFLAPVDFRSDHQMYDSSASIIGSWFQSSLLRTGWESESLIQRSEEGSVNMYESKKAVLEKDGRKIVITDSNEGFKPSDMEDIEALALFDDWSLSGAHFSYGTSHFLRSLKEHGRLNQNTPVEIVYGYMTDRAQGVVRKQIGKVLDGELSIETDKDFTIQTADKLINYEVGSYDISDIRGLTPFGFGPTGKSLDDLLIASAISVPDNTMSIVRSGISTKEFTDRYPGKRAPLVLNPRTDSTRGVYIQ